MADKKVVKVKALADKYGVSVKEIIKELETQGFAVKNASSVIPADAVDLVRRLRRSRQKRTGAMEQASARPSPFRAASPPARKSTSSRRSSSSSSPRPSAGSPTRSSAASSP
jgi:hypothetical protein